MKCIKNCSLKELKNILEDEIPYETRDRNYASNGC